MSLPIVDKVLDSLNGVYTRLRKSFSKNKIEGLSNIHVQGSLINIEGRGFLETRSDIDLLVSTSAGNAYQRTQFIIALKPWLQQFEDSLISDLKGRDSFPIVGVCIATQFELEEGIHKNRNTSEPYNNKIFLRLGLDESTDKLDEEEESNDLFQLEPVGNRLSPDLVDGFFFSAWSVLAEAQYFRSSYANPGHSNDEHKSFESPYLVLPKNLLRNAYIFRSLVNSQQPAMQKEDDIANGLDEIRNLLRKEGTDTSDAILALIETNRPGGKGRMLPIAPEQILYLWEILSFRTEEAVRNLRKNASSEDLDYASDDVLRELLEIKATSLRVVDKSVLFFHKGSIWDNVAQIKVLPHRPIDFYNFPDLDEEKRLLLATEWPKDIKKYLLSRKIKAGVNSSCKVGFSGLLHTQAGIGYPPQIVVKPLTHWVTEQFNREMIAQPDNATLQKIRTKYARTLFKPTGDYECICPSNLYIEVAIVTSDLYVPKLSKNSLNSPQGRGTGRDVFTCGVEYAFSWKEHVDEDKEELKTEQALMDGLNKELNLRREDIRKWSISSLAIQHSHLNSSILGVVVLNIKRGELIDRIGETLNSDSMPFKKAEFLTIPEAYRAVETDKSTGDWHQTALMRINLIDLKRDLA